MDTRLLDLVNERYIENKGINGKDKLCIYVFCSQLYKCALIRKFQIPFVLYLFLFIGLVLGNPKKSTTEGIFKWNIPPLCPKLILTLFSHVLYSTSALTLLKMIPRH